MEIQSKHVWSGFEPVVHPPSVIVIAPGGGLELAFPVTAAAVGTH